MHTSIDFFNTISKEFKKKSRSSHEGSSENRSAKVNSKNSIPLSELFKKPALKRQTINETTIVHNSTGDIDAESQIGDATIISHRRQRLSNSELEDADNELDFPEGGLHAWLAVLGSFLGLTNCFGTINSTAAIETYISQHQLDHVSASVVGWIFSIYVCVALLFGVFTGHFFDTQGPRVPIMIGGVLTVGGVLATANCSQIYQFILAFGVVAGLGTAAQMPSLVGIISHYFYRKRGMAIGIATIGGSVGGAVFPILLRKLYSTLGFVWAMRIFAFTLGMLNLAAVFLIIPRFPPKKSNVTQDMPLLPKLRHLFNKTIDFEAFKDPRFTFCTLGVTCSEVFLVTSMTYYGSYAVFKGNDEDTAYLLITIMNAMGIIARGAAGYGSDKLGKFNLMIGMVFFSCVFCLIIWLPFGHTTAGLYAFSVAYGIASAAVLSLSPLCVSQICRVEDFGRKYATCYFVVALGTLIGIPISGLFIGNNPKAQNYDNFIIFVSIIGFVGVACWTISRAYAVKFKLCIY